MRAFRGKIALLLWTRNRRNFTQGSAPNCNGVGRGRAKWRVLGRRVAVRPFCLKEAEVDRNETLVVVAKPQFEMHEKKRECCIDYMTRDMELWDCDSVLRNTYTIDMFFLCCWLKLFFFSTSSIFMFA